LIDSADKLIDLLSLSLPHHRQITAACLLSMHVWRAHEPDSANDRRPRPTTRRVGVAFGVGIGARGHPEMSCGVRETGAADRCPLGVPWVRTSG